MKFLVDRKKWECTEPKQANFLLRKGYSTEKYAEVTFASDGVCYVLMLTAEDVKMMQDIMIGSAGGTRDWLERDNDAKT